MKERDIRRLRRHTVFVRAAIILILIFGIISFVLYFDPSLLNSPAEQYRGNLIWLLVGIVFVGLAILSFFLVGHWSRRLLWIVYHTAPRPMHLVLKVEEDPESTQYYANLTPVDSDPQNQRIWRIALWGPHPENIKAIIGRDFKTQVYFDPKSGRPAVIESEFGLLWATAGTGGAEQKQ